MTWRGVFLLILISLLVVGIQTVQAAPTFQDVTPTPQTEYSINDAVPEQLSISNEVCLECHGQPGLTFQLEDGSNLDLYVPQMEYNQSIHGESGYACVQCHRQVGDYPHPAFSAKDPRDVSLKLNESCKYCHLLQHELALDSVHAAAQEAGNREAAVCVDCHTSHAVRRLKDPKSGELLPDARAWIPTTCARCHSLIYEKYKQSVHGAALIDEGNLDVPTCVDCHGVHNIEDPTTTYYRLNSPQMCANCHSDPKVVGKYGLSTEVLNTYVADFHGTTVVLFEKQSPDAETNKPVCFDCHGVHDISQASDPEKGLQVRQNLLARCQVCHPDATESFPDSWTSHYIPSPDKNSLVYYVNLFYKFFIPGVLGSMGLLVAMDIGRTNLNRYRARKRYHEEKEIQETAELTTNVHVIESSETAELLNNPEEVTKSLVTEEIQQVAEYDQDSENVDEAVLLDEGLLPDAADETDAQSPTPEAD